MKTWVPLAIGVLVLVSYALLYELGAAESQGASSIELVNTVGLAAVLVGLVAAVLILRRGAPPR